MLIQASCVCGSVRFQVEADAPTPYLRCYCSICRKTAGSGGYAINLGARADSLQVQGEEHVRSFQAPLPDGRSSPARRHFCGRCGSPLWVADPRWPALVHPYAGAVDTPLPPPPERVHMMLQSRAPWVAVEGAAGDTCFDTYPDQSLADWHLTHGDPR